MTGRRAPSVAELLARRDAWLAGPPGLHRASAHRLPVTRAIAESYETFYRLRRWLIDDHRGRGDGRMPHPTDRQAALLALFRRAGLVSATPDGRDRVVDAAARVYLTGGWLEELAFHGMVAAGADEVLGQQKIGWAVGPRRGINEVDVVARVGDQLSFVSCKAVGPWSAESERQREKLRTFLFEADYWDSHFGGDWGRALLLISADLIDEADGDRERIPSLFARAEVLQVDVVSLEDFSWTTLVARFRRHLGLPDGDRGRR